jgi:hypothetical protein
MVSPEESLLSLEKVSLTLFKETMSQASSVSIISLINDSADCNGGDNELKPYQIPVDFYTSGVSCAQCSVVIPDPWYEKCNTTLSFE